MAYEKKNRLNGKPLGGHVSFYSVWEDVQTYGPTLSFVHNFPLTGATSNGSDNWLLGGRNYDLTSALQEGTNELTIVTYRFLYHLSILFYN